MTAGTPFTAACVQLRTGDDMDVNIEAAGELIREAAARGGQFVVTPEMTHLMELASKPLFAKTVSQEQDQGLKTFRALAQELKIWLLIGSLAIRIADDKVANRAFLLRPDGGIAATYDKIHMFDVDLADGESYRESKNFRAGERAVLADLPWARLGLSICYDLRFSYLYRALAQAGADILAVPAAFTAVTGKAHWHILLRARAIETGCFVAAAAQGGQHENGRETYGHSLIIAPWGEILAEAGKDPCVIIAEIDPSKAAEARERIPSLTHDKTIQSKVI